MVSRLLGRGPCRDLASWILMAVLLAGGPALATPFGALWAAGVGVLAIGVGFFGVSHRRALPDAANIKRTFAVFMLGVAVTAAVGATLVRISGPLAVVLTFSASIATGYLGSLLGWAFAGMRRLKMAR